MVAITDSSGATTPINSGSAWLDTVWAGNSGSITPASNPYNGRLQTVYASHFKRVNVLYVDCHAAASLPSALTWGQFYNMSDPLPVSPGQAAYWSDPPARLSRWGIFHTSYFNEELPQLMTSILLPDSSCIESLRVLFESSSIGTRNRASVLPFQQSGMGSSLVYHAGALGDFLTTLPAMGVWRRLHERDTLVLLGRTDLAELASEGLFDEVWDARSSRFAPLFSGPVDRATSLGARLAAFQSALLFSYALSALPASLRGLGVGEILRQDPFPADRTPVVDYHLSLFCNLTLTAEDRVPRIRRGAGRIEVPPNTAALHPGSGDRRKNWPLEKFHALAEKLRKAGLTVQWVLGPAEEDAALPPGERTWRNADLSDLAAALPACRLFVGNDSGSLPPGSGVRVPHRCPVRRHRCRRMGSPWTVCARRGLSRRNAGGAFSGDGFFGELEFPAAVETF